MKMILSRNTGLVVFIMLLTLTVMPAMAKDALSVVPSTVASCIRVDFQHGQLMKKIVDLNDLLMDEETRRTMEEMKEAFGFSPMEKPFLLNILSVSFVTMQLDDKSKIPDLGLIVELKDAELFRQYLEKIKENVKAKGKKDILISDWTKSKFPVTVYEKTGDEPETIYTAFFDNLFAIGVGKEKGVQMLENMQSTAADNSFSIDKNKSYKALRDRFPPSAMVYAYLSGDYIAQDAELNAKGVKVDFLQGAALSLDYKDGRITGEGYVQFKDDAPDPLLRYLKDEPVPVASRAVLPAASLLYLVGRFGIPEEAFADVNVSAAIMALNSALGLDFVKDIMPWLGREYFLGIGDYQIVLTPPIPTPRVWFGISVKDPQKARDTMEKMEAAYKLRIPDTQFETGNEGELQYRYITVPTGGVLKDFYLTYGIAGNFLVFTTGKASVAEMGKVISGQIPSLNKDKRCDEMLGRAGKNALLAGYINGERLAALAEKFMETQNTPEAEMKDIRNIRALQGFGFGITHDGKGMHLQGSLAVDMELIKKLAQEPVSEDSVEDGN